MTISGRMMIRKRWNDSRSVSHSRCGIPAKRASLADQFKHRCDSGLRSGDGGVEAFGGEDDRAVHLVRFAFGLEARLPIRGIGQLGEAIKCGDGLCQTLSISINGKVIEVRAVGTGGLKADVIYPGLKRGGCGEDFPVCPSSGVGEGQGLVDHLVIYLEL